MNTLGPTGIWRDDILDAGATSTFRHNFFQYSISSPAILEMLMALSQAHIEQIQIPGVGPSEAVLQHRGKALTTLRKRLTQTNSASDDTVLILIIAFMALDSNYQDWTSFEANLKGFRQYVKLRGGIESLGWNGWAAWMAVWAELRWSSHMTQLAIAQAKLSGLKHMTYPEHPFSSEMCLQLSKLPKGFRELALSRSLSSEV